MFVYSLHITYRFCACNLSLAIRYYILSVHLLNSKLWVLLSCLYLCKGKYCSKGEFFFSSMVKQQSIQTTSIRCFWRASSCHSTMDSRWKTCRTMGSVPIRHSRLSTSPVNSATVVFSVDTRCRSEFAVETSSWWSTSWKTFYDDATTRRKGESSSRRA